eukprot:2196953-Rhodomonas_salina.2
MLCTYKANPGTTREFLRVPGYPGTPGRSSQEFLSTKEQRQVCRQRFQHTKIRLHHWSAPKLAPETYPLPRYRHCHTA